MPLLQWQMTVSGRRIRIFKVIRLPPLTFVFAKQNLRAQLHSEVVYLRISHGFRKFRQFGRIQIWQCNEWSWLIFYTWIRVLNIEQVSLFTWWVTETFVCLFVWRRKYGIYFKANRNNVFIYFTLKNSSSV
jgi:hypothetical protein